MTRKYIWWKSPEAALQHPKLIISKVMDIGDYHDVQKLAGFYSDDYLHIIVQTSAPGAFSPRSWAYWHTGLDWLSQAICLPHLCVNSAIEGF